MSPSATTHLIQPRPGVTGLIRAWGRAWNRHDAAAVAACCTPEVHYEDPALPRPAQGRREVSWFVNQLTAAFPDLRVEGAGPCRTLASGQVLVPWRCQATCLGPVPSLGISPTGGRIELFGVHVWELEDGLVGRHQGFYDLERVLRELGADHPSVLGEAPVASGWSAGRDPWR